MFITRYNAVLNGFFSTQSNPNNAEILGGIFSVSISNRYRFICRVIRAHYKTRIRWHTRDRLCTVMWAYVSHFRCELDNRSSFRAQGRRYRYNRESMLFLCFSDDITGSLMMAVRLCVNYFTYFMVRVMEFVGELALVIDYDGFLTILPLTL